MKTNNDLEKAIYRLTTLVNFTNSGDNVRFRQFLEFLNDSNWVLEKQTTRFVDDGYDYGWKVRMVFTRGEETFKLRLFASKFENMGNNCNDVFYLPRINKAIYINEDLERYSFDEINLSILSLLLEKDE